MKGKDRQSVADVALEHAGVADAMFQISRDNDIGLDAEVLGVEMNGIQIMDADVADYYYRRNHSPATYHECSHDIITDESDEPVTTTNNDNLEYEI